jgi:acyl-coenzyme A synthetase/AMP-(fatty) acid ligase
MKVKGLQVAPSDLEGCILDHPSVLDVCVVGMPDEYAGEVPLAFVVPTAEVGHSPEAVAIFKDSVIKVRTFYKRLYALTLEHYPARGRQ